MPTEVSAASDGVVHAKRVREATPYYLGVPHHGQRHPGDLNGPLSTTKQPPPHPGHANAAAWAATDCDVAGPSTSTPTARRPLHNHLQSAPPRATHNLTTVTTSYQKDHADAGSGTTGPTANQPTMRRLAPPGTDHAAIEPTPDYKQTTRKRAKTEPAGHAKVKTGTTSSGRATPWCATPTDDHTHQRNNAPHLYHYTTNQPTTTTFDEPPPPRESASSPESGGVSMRHRKQVP